MATIQLVRHATLLVTLDDTTLLVDPMLDPAGARDPIPNTPNDRRNPLVDLPDVDLDPDALLVTHLHVDHLDDPAVERFSEYPTLCQPEDTGTLADKGFTDLHTVDDSRLLDGVTVTRTPARHGHGELAQKMAPVSGFVLEAEGEPTVYVAGDTVWYEGVERTLEGHDPDVVVVNAGGARFVEGEPITMTADEVATVAAHTDAPVVAVHMESINHCLLERDTLRAAVADAGLDTVHVPDDGETLSFESPSG